MGTDIRPEVSKKNKYYISKDRYYELLHFCRQYKHYLNEYTNNMELGAHVNSEIHMTDIPDPTFDRARRAAYYRQKMQMIEHTCLNADPELSGYIFMAVTEGMSYNCLASNGMPAGKNLFYDRYRKFFWLLDRVRG